MNRRSLLGFLATLPFAGLLLGRSEAQAAVSPATASVKPVPIFPRKVAGIVQFGVTPEDLESRWVLGHVNGREVNNGVKVPSSGLIAKFQAALEPYRGLREIGENERLVIYFWHVTPSGEWQPWGQAHEMTVRTQEVLVRRRYAIIDRALALQQVQCRRNGINPDPTKLNFVTMRFANPVEENTYKGDIQRWDNVPGLERRDA